MGLRRVHRASGDQACADLAATTISNLEETGPPCWRRWLAAIDLSAPIVTYPTAFEGML